MSYLIVSRKCRYNHPQCVELCRGLFTLVEYPLCDVVLEHNEKGPQAL